jgi:hypothetical protein
VFVGHSYVFVGHLHGVRRPNEHVGVGAEHDSGTAASICETLEDFRFRKFWT